METRKIIITKNNFPEYVKLLIAYSTKKYIGKRTMNPDFNDSSFINLVALNKANIKTVITKLRIIQ